MGASREGMKTYVELIQRKERELGTVMLTQQKLRTSTFQAYSCDREERGRPNDLRAVNKS
jgi:isocitrate lyase